MSTTQVQTAVEADPINFDSLQLQVGTRLQLGVTRDVKQIQLFSSVIGWMKNDYLLLQMPLEGTQPFPLREGERLTARVFSGVQVCWFHTIVLRTFMHPYLYMHVSFPKDIGGTQLRSALRVRVDIPAKICVPGDSDGIPARMRNLSISGAALETSESLPEHIEKIEIRFMLPMPQGLPTMELKARAVVRNLTAAPAGDSPGAGSYSYGVQFVGLDATHKLALQNLIYETLMSDRQKLV